MTNEEFLRQLAVFRAQLVDEVIENYKQDKERHGDLAFERWAERFLDFLSSYLPNEAKRLNGVISMVGLTSAIAGRRRGTPTERFMRCYGERVLAFIDSLRFEVEKKRLNIHDTASTMPRAVESNPAETQPPFAVNHHTQNIFNAPVGTFQQGDHNSSSVSQKTGDIDDGEPSEADEPLCHETKKISPNEHRAWSFELKVGAKIKFAVDSDYPVDIYLTDSSAYENWRNGSEMCAYDRRMDSCRATGEFVAPKVDDYFIVVSNEGKAKTKVDLLVT